MEGSSEVLRRPKGRSHFLKRSFAALGVLSSPSALYAQSCALCYQTAANSGSHFIQALKHGILILLFPPLCIGTGIAIMAYRKRNQYFQDWESVDERDEVLRFAAEDSSSGPQQSSVGFTTSSVIASSGQ
jgi:hypothetical protein